MLRQIFLYTLSFLLLIYFFIIIKLDVTYSDYKDFLLVLLNVSGMVFTLMGIWIAFLYPNALKRIVDPDKVENADFTEALVETKRLESIVASVLKSAIVVTAVMIVFFIRVILSKSGFYLDNQNIFECIAISLGIVLSVLQLESVFHVVVSNIMFINDLHSKRETREQDNDV